MAISLKEAARLIRTGDTQLILEDGNLLEFLSEADRLGGEILSPIAKDEMIAAISLLQSVVMTDLLSDGEMGTFMFILSHIKEFGSVMAVAMKISVGIAAMEEWR